jgi:L-fuconolactonase
LFESGFTGRYGLPRSGGDDLGLYSSLRRVHDIGTALVVGYEGESAYVGNNSYIGGLVDYDWIHPIAFVKPDEPSVPAAPFVGISIYLLSATDTQELADWPPHIINGLADMRAVVSINATPEVLEHAKRTIQQLEGCRVLISHLGGPRPFKTQPSQEEARGVAASLLALAEFAYVGVKVSGLYGISDPPHDYPHRSAWPFIDLIAEAFGTERLYWGSDFSPALDYVSFAQTIDAVSCLAWSDHERLSVMGGNLRRLLEIKQ